MMLKIPLASLPPGRGGLSASLKLIYNKQIYDSFPTTLTFNIVTTNVTNLKQQLKAVGGQYA